MKKILIALSVLLASSLALASTNPAALTQTQQPTETNIASHIILGTRVGLFANDEPAGTAFNLSLPVAGQLYAGYQFNQYIALTTGYTHFRHTGSDGNATYGPDHYYLNAFDLSTKLMLPIAHGFYGFISPGIALVHLNVYNKTYQADPTPRVDINTYKVAPELGIGLGFDMTRHLGMEFFGNYIAQSGPSSAITFFGLGFYVKL